MDIKIKAARIRNLMNDDTFKEVIQEVKQRQIDVFTNESSVASELTEAHNIIRALGEIEGYLKSVLTDEKMFDHKHNH